MPGDGSRGHGARGSLGVAAGPSGGCWSYEARGSSRASLCQEMGAAGHAGMCACFVFHL
jgi:hypothetical protein